MDTIYNKTYDPLSTLDYFQEKEWSFLFTKFWKKLKKYVQNRKMSITYFSYYKIIIFIGKLMKKRLKNTPVYMLKTSRTRAVSFRGLRHVG